jgi:2-iminobutanoate/2-iminopropanoate deaminase
MVKKVFKTSKVFDDGGPYSQAVIAGKMIFLSGQAAIDPKTLKPVPGGIEAQSRATFDNIRTILKEAGASLADVVRVLIFLNDIRDYAAANSVYREYFASEFPARTCVEGHLEEGYLIEAEVMAILPE